MDVWAVSTDWTEAKKTADSICPNRTLPVHDVGGVERTLPEWFRESSVPSMLGIGDTVSRYLDS